MFGTNFGRNLKKKYDFYEYALISVNIKFIFFKNIFIVSLNYILLAYTSRIISLKQKKIKLLKGKLNWRNAKIHLYLDSKWPQLTLRKKSTVHFKNLRDKYIFRRIRVLSVVRKWLILVHFSTSEQKILIKVNFLKNL